MEATQRRDFAVPAAVGVVDGIDLAVLNRDDEDDRRILIEAEHPELRAALRRGACEVRAAFAALPASWEQMPTELPTQPRSNGAERRTATRRRHR